MARLNWNANGERIYETGVDRGVLYPSVGPGVAWDGLTSVQETPSDVETKITYMDGQKIQTRVNLGTFAAQISAYTYPQEFEEYDGLDDGWSGQSRKPFNFSYRTLLVNDLAGESYGYQIHLVFNAIAMPTVRDYGSIDSVATPTQFQWDISTRPVSVADARPSSHLIIDSTQVYPAALIEIEEILYGTFATEPRFPSMQEILDLFDAYAIFRVTDHGDGTATITGPDSAVAVTGVDTATFSWPSVVWLDDESYRLSSL